MAGESKQIYQLTNGTFNGSSLVPFEVPNTDPSTSTDRPYITRKTTGDEVSEFVAKTQEFETDLQTTDKHIIGAINELKANDDKGVEELSVSILTSGLSVKPRVFKHGHIVIVHVFVNMPAGTYSGAIWKINNFETSQTTSFRNVVKFGQQLTDCYVNSQGEICINGLTTSQTGYLIGEVVLFV